MIIPCIILIAVRSNNIYSGIIGTILCTNKFICAFGVNIDIGISKMSSESAVCSFKKKPDRFTCHAIQANGHRGPILKPNRRVTAWIGRCKETGKEGSIRNESERRAGDNLVIGHILNFYFHSWLFLWSVIWILAHDCIMIN